MKNYSRPYQPDGKREKKNGPRYATEKRSVTKKSGKNVSTDRETVVKKFDKPKRSYQMDEEEMDRSNLIEGRNAVLEAIKSGREIDKLFVQKGSNEGSIRQIIAIAKDKGLLIKEVDKAKLDRLSVTNNHQGVIASAALYRYYEVSEILEMARAKKEDPFLVILDEISDPQNLGSILRSCEGAGVHGIIIPKRRAASLTPIVAKISAGAIEYVPVAKVTNIAQTIEGLKKEGLWIAGTDMQGSPYYNKEMTGPIGLVIGNEGEGMGRLVKDACDYIVSIPMQGKISSLNAAVSTAIVVYDIKRQRDIGRG